MVTNRLTERFFLPKPVRPHHTKVLTNQDVTCGILVFAKNLGIIFSGMFGLRNFSHAGPTCQRKNNLKYQATEWKLELTTRAADLARVATSADTSFSRNLGDQ
jgi:hypothetical protein